MKSFAVKIEEPVSMIESMLVIEWQSYVVKVEAPVSKRLELTFV